MVEIFKKNDINVNLYPIEKSDSAEINLNHTIGLAFPVAGLSTYPFVWKFLESLPEANGTSAFMLDTLGGVFGRYSGTFT